MRFGFRGAAENDPAPTVRPNCGSPLKLIALQPAPEAGKSARRKKSQRQDIYVLRAGALWRDMLRAGGNEVANAPKNAVRRQVVLAPNWIGDAAMAAPFFASLRAAFPEDQIEVAAVPWTTGLLSAFPWVDAVRPLDAGKWRRFFSVRPETRGERIETLWLLPNSFRAALLGRIAGARQRVGYASGGRGWLLTNPVPPPPESPPPHLTDAYLGLLEAEGIEPAHRSVRLPVTPEAEAFAGGLLSSEAPGDGPLAGIHPGAFFGKSKTWPAESYGELARLLADRSGARVLILGGPDEVEVADRVAEASGGAARSIAGKDTLATLPALLARLGVLVSGDTGPLHIAALVGTKTVSLFGPTDPRRTAPRGEGHRILRRELECSPCFKRTCPLGHHRCMKDIAPEEVAGEAARMLTLSSGSKRAGAGAAK